MKHNFRSSIFGGILLSSLYLLSATQIYAAGFERRNVTFKSEGIKCSAWYYVPKNLDDRRKTACNRDGSWLECGEGSSRQAMLLSFAEAGFAVLSFDYRYLGESEGEPRGQLFYQDQQEDYRNAITWVSHQKEVDAGKIGVWGTSYSGGHVLQLAAFDKRVKTVVSQVPGVNFWEAYYQPLKPEELAGEFTMYAKARSDFFENGKVN